MSWLHRENMIINASTLADKYLIYFILLNINLGIYTIYLLLTRLQKIYEYRLGKGGKVKALAFHNLRLSQGNIAAYLRIVNCF